MHRTWDLARQALRPAMRRELRSVASAAVLYPFGVSSAASAGLLRLLSEDRPAPAHPVRTPVVLVHGYGGNRANWLPLQDRLGSVGFVNLHAMLYNPLRADLPQIAQQLVDDCRAARRDAGADRVHVIGHSLGGIVLRYAVAHLGLAEHLDLGMTIASPHGGAAVARFGRGPVAAALRPGSALLQGLAASGSSGVRWVCYWSDADYVVPPASAGLWAPELGATNVPVPEEGHVSILGAPVLLSDAAERLLRAEHRAEPPEPARDHSARTAPAAPLVGAGAHAA